LREVILSVGIDIGTSTTQLVFSKITIENTASGASIPQIRIVGKEIIYKSDIHFTPLTSQIEINGWKVREIVEQEYKKARVEPSQIRTGAVIITGETARKENAAHVLETLSGLAGEFVVATAGPDLEAIIAGKGAGAERISREKGSTVANLDIGGGTTNIAVFKEGQVVDTVSLDIGGRLIKFKANSSEVGYIAPKISKIATELGLQLQEGTKIPYGNIEKITDRMTEILEEAMGIKEPTPLLTTMFIGKNMKTAVPIEYITFSGGVADAIYESERDNLFKYGDIGIVLGNSIKKSKLMSNFKILRPEETIRATVVGAGSHTVEISGSTITYAENVLPLKNIPILKMSSQEEALLENVFAGKIKEKIRWFGIDDSMQQVALAIKGVKNPSFQKVQEIAKSIVQGMSDVIELYPLIVIVENDMAKVLGQTLQKQLSYKKDVVCIDSVEVDNGDYIDIGKPLANGRVVPVAIKTLIFNA